MLKIKSALISVFDKKGIAEIAKILDSLDIKIYSTGGTEVFLKGLKIDVIKVEDITSYPSILNGRVKTLHPKVFGGILNRRSNKSDNDEINKYNIPSIDLIIVDLYPFEKTVESAQSENDIIEKIDIGGISLIRAAAKNFKDVMTISSKDQYKSFIKILENNNGKTDLETRKKYSAKAFNISSHYDTAIFNYFNTENITFKSSFKEGLSLRYGENPHQNGYFFGDLKVIFEQLNGKELSYNNLLDVDSATNLMKEFDFRDITFAILKHNNACGLAIRNSIKQAYIDALSSDPISAFGGVLITNQKIGFEVAKEINKLFCEIVIAPDYENSALELLKTKKNRIILKQKETKLSEKVIRTCLNGILVQDKDLKTDNKDNLKVVTNTTPKKKEIEDLLFASKICKHTKSNTIVLVKNKQLISSGTGQTSRVDALKHAIQKAKNFDFDLSGAVMASDAFFPFPDCVEIAHKHGIISVIQPGGSIKDHLSTNFCNDNNISMVHTGIRHFKH